MAMHFAYQPSMFHLIHADFCGPLVGLFFRYARSSGIWFYPDWNFGRAKSTVEKRHRLGPRLES
jgi:hypothetical protein